MNTVNVKKVGNYYIYTSEDSILGAGTQATVYLAKRSTDNLHLAAKVFDITQNFSDKDLESIRRQLDILFATKHPYILNCYDFIQTKNNIYMFSEYCDGGDLLNYINNRQFISESECLDIFKQIVSALQVLDKNNIAHRDLKTANILLSGGEVKLADFGFAKRIQPNNKSILNTYVGSPIFMSPQALIGGAYDLKKSDVWSAGICLYYMLFKAYPFNSQLQDLEELKHIVANTPLTFPELPKRSKQVKELLTKMLEKDEQQRYDLNQVANHECLTYSSSKSVNPLLRSSEINQVTGISSFNPNLKEQALVQGVVVPPQNSQSMDFANRRAENNLDDEQIRQGQEKFLNQIDTNKNIMNLHNLVMLFASLPQKHTEIWKSIKKYALDGLLQHLGDNIEDARQALVLLMVTLYLLARREMKDMLNCTKQKITKAIVRLLSAENQKKNNEQLLITYFNQETYKCLMKNMSEIFEQSEKQHEIQTQELLKILKEERFSYSVEEIEKDLDGIIDLVFYNLSDYLNTICNTAVKNNNKPILNLLANILLMRLYEIKITKEEFDFKTYYELIQALESINFQSAAQLNNTIQEMKEKLKKYEDDDEKDGGD